MIWVGFKWFKLANLRTCYLCLTRTWGFLSLVRPKCLMILFLDDV